MRSLPPITANLCSSFAGNSLSLFDIQATSLFLLQLYNPETTQPPYTQSHHRSIAYTESINLQHIVMAPGASSTNNSIREFYAPRITEPSTTKQRQSIPRAEHRKPQRPIQFHNSHASTNHVRPDDNDELEIGCLGEIKNYKAGDEFVLLWKWVDDFMDKRRAKQNSSKSYNVNNPTLRQPKPTPSSSREARRIPKPATAPSTEAVRRPTDRKVLCEYKAQRPTPWGKLLTSYGNWKDQQAEKEADQGRQRMRQEIAGRQASGRRDEPTRGRSPNRREPPQTTLPPPDQDHTPGIVKKPVPVYNKKRGEVPKHTVNINQVPPIHNSVHLQHTPSNNYRTRPSGGHKGQSARDTRFSDFLHQERNPSTHETQRPSAAPGGHGEPVRDSRFSSRLDPAKEIRRAKEAEKAKGLKCYICSSMNCPGGYRDNITNLWVCAACQQKENLGPKECQICGTPNSPNTTYADNCGLWLCSNCRSPTTEELPPIPKLSLKATSKPNDAYCECDTPCPSIEKFDDSISLCPFCEKRLTPFPVVPLSEYNSDHLYSDDSYETEASTPPASKPIGLGITFPDPEDEDEEKEEEFRPTPPLKDSKYFQESPTLPPSSSMDYNQSYLRKPGATHPYAPSSSSSSTTTITGRKALPETKTSSSPKPTTKPTPRQTFKTTNNNNHQTRHPYPYPYPYPPPPPRSPPTTTTTLHKPRPASSVYISDEQPTTTTTTLDDLPYLPPRIPSQYANSRPLRRLSSSVPASRASSLNRRSSWYDFWKPVFERSG